METTDLLTGVMGSLISAFLVYSIFKFKKIETKKITNIKINKNLIKNILFKRLLINFNNKNKRRVILLATLCLHFKKEYKEIFECLIITWKNKEEDSVNTINYEFIIKVDLFYQEVCTSDDESTKYLLELLELLLFELIYLYITTMHKRTSFLKLLDDVDKKIVMNKELDAIANTDIYLDTPPKDFSHYSIKISEEQAYMINFLRIYHSFYAIKESHYNLGEVYYKIVAFLAESNKLHLIEKVKKIKTMGSFCEFVDDFVEDYSVYNNIYNNRVNKINRELLMKKDNPFI
jgi:hypothetical protein